MRLDAELGHGEHAVWVAKPRPRRQLRSFGIYLFAIPWTGFSVFWMAMAGSGHGTPDVASVFFTLFGLPFLLIGIGMLAVPFAAVAAARRTVYALTDRRLLRIGWGRRRTVTKSVLLSQIGPITRTSGTDGYGDLKIETHTRSDGDGGRTTETFSLDGVPDVAGLERLLLEATHPARAPHSTPREAMVKASQTPR
jgi:hypothetical protein